VWIQVQFSNFEKISPLFFEADIFQVFGCFICLVVGTHRDLVWPFRGQPILWVLPSFVITTFSSVIKPGPASVNPTGVSPVANSSSVTSAAIAAVAAARDAAVAASAAANQQAAQVQAAQAAAIAAQAGQQVPAVTGIITASTVNGRKRRISNSAGNVTNGINPSSYPRMENSSNLSQSMDSVNTASGEEEVGTNWFFKGNSYIT
jgi:hypothetical protein